MSLEHVGPRWQFRDRLRHEDDVRGRRVRHEQWLDHDEPHLRGVRKRHLQHDDQRCELRGMVYLRRGHVREHGRNGHVGPRLHDMRRWHVHEHRKPSCVHSTWFMRRRHGTNRCRHIDQSKPVHDVPCRHVLPWRHNSQDNVRKRDVGPRREFFDGVRREDRLCRRSIRDQRRLGHCESHVRGLPERKLQHDHECRELHGMDDMRRGLVRQYAWDRHERSRMHGLCKRLHIHDKRRKLHAVVELRGGH